MNVVLQRVLEARVEVDGQVVGRITTGLLLLVGIAVDDSAAEIRWMADKVKHLRIFRDDEGKMNRSLRDVEGSILAVSQFTLLGDPRKGRRPNFERAAAPDKARQLFDHFVAILREDGTLVETGQFGMDMQVHLINSGPVTILLERSPASSENPIA